MKKLTEYIKLNSAQLIADQIGVHRAQVYRWAKGESEPGVRAAIRLEDATGGAVPVRAWVE